MESVNHPDEAMLRKLSRVVLRAAKHDQGRELFDDFTAQNAARIAELMKQKPVFFENDEDAPTSIDLDPEIATLFPAAFWENPTQWIESLSPIQRTEKELPCGESIEELWGKPYDRSKVKECALTSGVEHVALIVKRIVKNNGEVERSRKAYDAGILTPRILGEVRHWGNHYAFFEKIDAINVYEFLHSSEYQLISDIPTREYFSNWLIELKKVCKLTREDESIIRAKFIQFDGGAIYHTVSHKVNEFIPEGNSHENLSPACRKNYVDFFSLRLSNLPPDILSCVLLSQGFRSQQHFFETVYSNTSSSNKALATLFKNAYYEQYALLYREFFGLLSEYVLGFDLSKESEKLKDLCQKNNIPHKDFHNRNLLIGKKSDGQGCLFLIDWEEAGNHPINTPTLPPT